MIEKYKDAGLSDLQGAKVQNLHSIDELEATNSVRNKLEINSTEEAFLSGSEDESMDYGISKVEYFQRQSSLKRIPHTTLEIESTKQIKFSQG